MVTVVLFLQDEFLGQFAKSRYLPMVECDCNCFIFQKVYKIRNPFIQRVAKAFMERAVTKLVYKLKKKSTASV